jgi:hypothetical protein
MTLRNLLPLLSLVSFGLVACDLKEKNLGDPKEDTGEGSTDGDTIAANTSESSTTNQLSTGPNTTADTGGPATGGTTGDPLQCNDPLVFPDVDKVCVVDQDCALVLHQLNCCGSMAALGIDADDVDAFNQSEAACAADSPQCDCASVPTTAEDGQTEQDGEIVVTCDSGICESEVKDDGALQWYTTCGDPVCSGYTKPDGVPLCTPEQMEGNPCDAESTTCDPVSDCNALLVCATKDPKPQEADCPISRARFKTEIEYLQPADLERYAADLKSLRLATYRYREAPTGAPPRLGVILEDNEQGIWVDARHDRVDLYGYTSLAVATLQLQQRQLAVMQAEIDQLSAELQMSPICGP